MPGCWRAARSRGLCGRHRHWLYTGRSAELRAQAQAHALPPCYTPPCPHRLATGTVRMKRRGGGWYATVKLASGRWRGLARVVWEQARGPIPPGHVVRTRSGDGRDCRLENLMLLSRRLHFARQRTLAAEQFLEGNRKAGRTCVRAGYLAIARLAAQIAAARRRRTPKNNLHEKSRSGL